MQEVEPYQSAFQQHLARLQGSLSSVVASLSLNGTRADDELSPPERSSTSDEVGLLTGRLQEHRSHQSRG